MEEKLYLHLFGHTSDRKELQRFVETANGDVETFQTLYRERFRIAARLINEDHPMFSMAKENDKLIAIN